MSPQIARKIIIFLLRFLGINALLALVFLVMPFSWIREIHTWFGLGEMPSASIVIYLTRSLCLFYGLFGVILIAVSFDIDRYRPLIGILGLSFPIIGIIVLGIDIFEKLPLSWILSQGPFMVVVGLVFLWAFRKMPQDE